MSNKAGWRAPVCKCGTSRVAHAYINGRYGCRKKGCDCTEFREASPLVNYRALAEQLAAALRDAKGAVHAMTFIDWPSPEAKLVMHDTAIAEADAALIAAREAGVLPEVSS